MIAKIINNHQIEIYDLSQFDIKAILHSGQVFRYQQTDQGYLLYAGNHWAVIVPKADVVVITCDDANFFFDYFDLATDYEVIKQTLAWPYLQNAIRVGGGIRILRGNFVEVVISFIISANNNIKRFSQTLAALCEQYGTLLQGQDCNLLNNAYAFPTLEQLSRLTVADFRCLGCGYRDQYLVKAIKQLATMDYAALSALPTENLRRELLTLAGVGPKVADCILLFAFRRYEVVPVDTWIKKALEKLTPAQQTALWQSPYAGVAQQYMFYALQYLHTDLS